MAYIKYFKVNSLDTNLWHKVSTGMYTINKFYFMYAHIDI